MIREAELDKLNFRKTKNIWGKQIDFVGWVVVYTYINLQQNPFPSAMKSKIRFNKSGKQFFSILNLSYTYCSYI